MGSTVRILSAETIDSLVWPDTAHARSLKEYLVPLMRSGPKHFIDNADVTMLSLLLDDEVLPLVVGDGKRGNSCVCSFYSHYVDYAWRELGKVGNLLARWTLRTGLALLGVLLRICRIDRFVCLNNWLWTTNPCPRLSSQQVAAVTAHLVENFPDRVIVFRSVNRTWHEPFLDALLDNGYFAVASRKIYLLDAAGRGGTLKHNLSEDLDLLEDSPYAVIGNDELSEADIPRITALYRGLYLGKYPQWNPQFNEKFFELVVKGGMLECRALRRQARIDAFVIFHVRDGIMIPPGIGYDLGLPRDLGLYRQMVALLIREAGKRGVLMNMSAGAGEFKEHRGGVPTVEFDVVYDAHLPLYRRIPWRFLRFFFSPGMIKKFHD